MTVDVRVYRFVERIVGKIVPSRLRLTKSEKFRPPVFSLVIREFCFDLPLPVDFTPANTDGETETFYLWSIERVREELTGGDFKPNVAIVILDFLIRHGFLHPDEDVHYCEFLEGIHKTI